MNNKLYIIDGSSFLYRAYFALPYLSTSKGMPTRVVYGFAKMLQKLLREHNPTHIAVVFDSKGPNFRHEMMAEYKIKRPPLPSEIALQIPYVHELLSAMNIKIIMQNGVEADDIIAKIATEFKKNMEIIIVTADKDLYQLIDENVKVWHPHREIFIDKETAKTLLGVCTNEIADFLSLAGDSVDGVPGVKGIGEKTAVKLINEYGNLEEIYKNINNINEKLRNLLLKDKEMAFLSRQLCMLHPEKCEAVNLDELKVKDFDKERLLNLLKQLEFYELIKEYGVSEKLDLTIPEFMPFSLPLKDKKVYFAVTGWEDGIIFTCSGSKVHYVNNNNIQDFFNGQSCKYYTFDGKACYRIFDKYNIENRDFFDCAIISYLLNPSANHIHAIEDVFKEHFGVDAECVKGKKINLFDEDTQKQKVALYVKHMPQMVDKLINEFNKNNELQAVYENIEHPLTPILVHMENAGIKIDIEYLDILNNEISQKLNDLEKNIYSLTGSEFNLNSPKQLSHVLYDILGLKPVKKKKNSYSTASDVLEELYLQHPVIPLVIEYRNLSKLKNTYIDVLPSFVDRDGRVHTTFNQTLTTTGRLSSSNPNLQNIPIKFEWGEKIRKAFIADEGFLLLSADYSQIEIRILAELSKDENLLRDFLSGFDIHTATASKIFGLPIEKVTRDMRRQAKTINFGILYGMGSHSLSKELGVKRSEAEMFIKKYFENYVGVQRFREGLIEFAKQNKYVKTYFGRKRYIYEIDSTDAQVRSNAERIALNTPLQGTAADIVKKAMIDVFFALKNKNFNFKMLLQIHDEILLEVEEKVIEEAKYLVKEKMEKVVNFTVPLVVKVGIGKNWFEASK